MGCRQNKIIRTRVQQEAALPAAWGPGHRINTLPAPGNVKCDLRSVDKRFPDRCNSHSQSQNSGSLAANEPYPPGTAG